MSIRLAIVGVEGLPNRYGGFETLASYLAKYLSEEIETTVYCSSLDIVTRASTYKGAYLKYIHLSSHGLQGVLYDIFSLHDALNKNDVVLFLGFGAGIYFPFLSKKNKSKLILNFGGLDWQRSKWNAITRKVIKYFESLMVQNVNWVIADNKKIADYILATYQKHPIEISYGGDQAFAIELSNEIKEKHPFLNKPYACAVCRIQPDNNVELILKAFSKTNFSLVMIGNWGSSSYGRKIKQTYSHIQNLHLLDAIYDSTNLNMIRCNCSIYVHGHSAGGTNPSLLEAMHLGLNIFAYQSGYNEITTNHMANYFSSEEELVRLIENSAFGYSQGTANKIKQFAVENYTWNKVAESYKKLIFKVYNQHVR
jgi:glycosyltransferase involved in cell wall biosynthesis